MMRRGVSRNLGAVPWCTNHVGAMPVHGVLPAQTVLTSVGVASVWEFHNRMKGRP